MNGSELQVNVEQFDCIHEKEGLKGVNEGAGIENTLGEGVERMSWKMITGDVGGGYPMCFHSNLGFLWISSHNYSAL